MKTADLFIKKRLVMSAEVFPPKKSGTMEGVIRALKDIRAVSPDFVSVTYGASGSGGDTTADVASVARDALDLETVAHLTAVNMTADRLESQLAILKNKGIENILVLRGDVAEGSAFYDFSHASDLAAYISARHPAFNLLGACYPEGHFEAKSLDEDVDYVRRKVDCGVRHLITQLFFDNGGYYDFMDRLEKKGVRVPVSAGIMPVLSASQIKRIVSMCGASMPAAFTRIIARYEGCPEAMAEAGVAYAVQQIVDLISGGARGIHLYTMNRGEVARRVFGAVAEIRRTVE